MTGFRITKMGKGEVTDCFATNTNFYGVDLNEDISQVDFTDHYVFRIRPALDDTHEVFVQLGEDNIIRLGFGWRG